MFDIFFFFFQAEDGIRDYKVTGVQTCALPIYSSAVGGVALSTVCTTRRVDGVCAVAGAAVATTTIEQSRMRRHAAFDTIRNILRQPVPFGARDRARRMIAQEALRVPWYAWPRSVGAVPLGEHNEQWRAGNPDADRRAGNR